jgi:hypothetical protein
MFAIYDMRFTIYAWMGRRQSEGRIKNAELKGSDHKAMNTYSS